jgi:cytochrome c oxidase subunit 2
MANRDRRRTLAAGLALVGLGAAGLRVAAQSAEPVIRIVAKKFDYAPGEIRLKKGVPVVLELTSADVVMGFSIPDFGVRADILPGRTVRVRFVPDKAGTFTFFCDIFCGTGHEDMNGTMTVVE